MNSAENLLRGLAEFFEILPEQPIQGLGLTVVGGAVLPLAPRIQNSGRDTWATDWNGHVENRVRHACHLIELARNGRIHHGASVFQIHPLTHAEPAAYPAGVHEETLHVVLPHFLAQHPGVLQWRTRTKQRAEPNAQGSLPFAAPSTAAAGQLSCVT